MFLRIALALFILVLPIAAHAAEIPDLIGTAVEVEGTAQRAPLDPDLETTALKNGDAIFLNDKITTGADSKLLILFIDDTQVTLGEDAFLTVDEYVFDPATNVESYARFKPLKGAFLFVSGWLTKAQKPQIEIETPTASLGIRGTVVWGGWLDDDYGVLVQEGEVSVKNDTGSVLVRAGEGVNLRGREIRPSEIKAWAQDRIDRAVGTISLANVDAIRPRMDQEKQKNLQRRRDHADLIATRREQRRQIIEDQRGENREKMQEKIEERQEKLPDRELPRKTIHEQQDLVTPPAPKLVAPQPEPQLGPSPDSAESKRLRREQRSREWIKNRKAD